MSEFAGFLPLESMGEFAIGEFAGKTTGKFTGKFAGSGLYKKGSLQQSFSLALPGSEERAL